MDEKKPFALELFQHPWRPGTAEVQAVIRVSAQPGDDRARDLVAAGAAEVIILDCSGSMGHPVSKLNAAKRAAHAALGAMRDGTEFAVLKGTDDVAAVYPRHGLARAAPDTRAAGADAVNRLYAAGRTQISRWLSGARELLAPYPGHVRHAMLFTDGKNQHESRDGTLDRVIGDCHGTFTCDARGVGDEWDAGDLRKIVSALHGQADGLPDAAGLEDDFRAVMREAMRKSVPDVALRVRTRAGVAIREVRQLYPANADLTGYGTRVGEAATDYWIGSWGEEIRDYRVTLLMTDADFGDEANPRLARVDITLPAPARLDGTAGPDGPVTLAEPAFVVASPASDDLPVPTDLPSGGYARQEDADDAITAGCHHWYGNDLPAAERAWGEAVRHAAAAGDARRLTVLESLVHIEDAAAGRVRLRDDVGRALVLRAESRAASSSFVPSASSAGRPESRPKPAGRADRPAAALAPCPHCGRRSPPGARFCEQCGRRLAAAGPGREGGGR